MKEETCISLSLRDRTDLGINQLLAERITLQRALPPWPNVPFQKKKKKRWSLYFQHKLCKVKNLMITKAH